MEQKILIMQAYLRQCKEMLDSLNSEIQNEIVQLRQENSELKEQVYRLNGEKCLLEMNYARKSLRIINNKEQADQVEWEQTDWDNVPSDLEEWKEFNGYKVSNFGRVINPNNKDVGYTYKTSDNTFKKVNIKINGKNKMFQVSTLVYFLFGNDPDFKIGERIYHKDGNRLNNYIGNLISAKKKNKIIREMDCSME